MCIRDSTATVSVRDDVDVVTVPTSPGDTTTTTPWGGPNAYVWDRAPEWSAAVMTQDGASYDVAEVTLEVRYWTPSAPPPPPGRR